MKCNKCGINYDDGDSQCPMCGAHKPAFKSDKSQLAKATGQLARPQQKNSKSVEPLSDQTHYQTFEPSRQQRQTTGKKKRNPFLIIILIFFLLQFIPVILSMVSGIFESRRNDRYQTYVPTDTIPVEYERSNANEENNIAIGTITYDSVYPDYEE